MVLAEEATSLQAADAREALDRLRSLTREGPSGGAHVAHEIEVQQLHARLAGALSEAELTRQKARLPEMSSVCPIWHESARGCP